MAFDIYENDEYGNALVADMTTGKDGTAVSPPLRKGRYIVRERGATAGYVTMKMYLWRSATKWQKLSFLCSVQKTIADKKLIITKPTIRLIAWMESKWLLFTENNFLRKII